MDRETGFLPKYFGGDAKVIPETRFLAEGRVISFPATSSGDLTAENTEDTEGENREMNNSDATGFDIN